MIPSRILALAGCLAALAPVAHADEARWRDCRTCHAVEAPDGRVLARGGRSGPNLYGIANRPVAGDPSFRFYSPDLRAVGQSGARWSEDNFVAYLTNPDQFLRAASGNPNAQSGMHVELRTGGRELFQWLQGLSN
ncbi:MAG: c-type cytochrome [Roseinatronobacter sp.]